ncbi:hypothetical protein GCM10018783_36200 [Streptomyces griseosporeus]|nr:hypothetical protein GCM10018783_36200 [Streptomyces griseosporeus]
MTTDDDETFRDTGTPTVRIRTGVRRMVTDRFLPRGGFPGEWRERAPEESEARLPGRAPASGRPASGGPVGGLAGPGPAVRPPASRPLPPPPGFWP